ncbi:serine hydrolase [Parvularcula dongshanensis]|uniref:CubicO group peptidase (Beta-lactamase class C family) n=1 Tax=Parvularcula dongshanensis TaxID=1173995 RepID=A0A840I399_9PROT|nr:CubicO group peptidase (beta-lactamase class C family) [Parvularcula dongshanensis]
MSAHGHTDPRFEGVRDAFEASLAAGDDLGAGVCVIVDGEPVVDLWGGHQDRQKTTPWEEDTLACVYSSGKAVLSAAILGAVSQGALDYAAPVSEVWPEFGGAGKQSVTLVQALSHQSGLPGFAAPKDPSIWLDWDDTCAALAEMEPMWPPGTASGYGPQTFGFIAGEVLRRATGRTIGEHLRTLGLEVHCSVRGEAAGRVARMMKPPRAPDLGEITPETRAAFLEPWSSPAGVDRDAWLAAEIPASNMHATARGLAEVMQVFATGRMGGKPFATDEALRAALAERVHGPDRVLPFELSWGAGVMRETLGVFGGSPTAVGHYGFGGSCVMADPARGLSFAYVPNKMSPHLVGDPRATALLRAVTMALR